MTKINKMVMHGFKSFAKKTELKFGESFNCVLGPNGSGKSNILDSLCFVLGRGSAKSLRAEKSANLIYNGGKSKQPAKQGEVSIYFDNANNTFPTPDKEIKITRIIKQSGQSIYKINDKKRTRQEILDLLSVAKIDPDGFNIILQGDVINFVNMSPIERRKIVEEVSGINVYEDKKVKALNELGKVDERLNEADIILTERNTYLKELKKERDQALKFKDVKDKIDSCKATYYDVLITKNQEVHDKYETQITKEKEIIKEMDTQESDLKQKIQEHQAENQKISNEIEEKGEKEQVELHKSIEQLKVDLAKNKTRSESLEQEIEKIKSRKKDLINDLKEQENNSKQHIQKKKEFEGLKQKKEKDLQTIEQQIIQFRKKNKIDDANSYEDQILSIEKDIEERQKLVQEVRSQQQELLREKDKTEFKIQSVDDKITKVLEVEKENLSQINDLKNKKALFKKITEELNGILDEDSMLASKLGDIRRELIADQEKYAKLNARSASINESISSDNAIRTILDMKKKIKGIHGTISELGNASKKYSVALETAAGNKMKGIVVEDDGVAAQCIKYLKQNRLGVASFIPLNKIRSIGKDPKVESLKGHTGVHDLAINLISYDSKFKSAFSYVFGNTLVVDSIEVTRKVGVGSAKMVTLDGDMADISGAMRGGFRKAQRGVGFKEKEVVRDLELVEARVLELQGKLSTFENRKVENERRIVELRNKKAEQEGEIIKIERSLHLEHGDLDVNKKLKEELRDELKKVDEELSKIQNSVSKFNRELANSQIEKQKLRSQINMLRNPRLVAELNAFEEKKSQLREELIKIDAEINNIGALIKMLSPEQDKINNIIKQHEKEIDEFGTEIKQLYDKVKVGEKDLKDREQKAKEFYAKYKELFNKRSTINDQINKFSNKIDSLRELSRRSEIKMNTLSLENARVKAELAGLKEQFKPFENISLRKERDEKELKKEINKFERMVVDMGNVNMKALEIYEKIHEEYNNLMEKKDKLKSEKDDIMDTINQIEDKKKDVFLKTLDVVNENFQKIFLTLSSKGQAFLRLEQPENPFDDGLKVMVKLNSSKFMDIRSLSGGEKTMTALAFMFAIQEHEPHSFYILDEVDAALDKHNSEKLAKLVRKYCDNAQYVVISHNDNVIGEADNLYGISMNEHGVTSVTTLKI